MSSQKFLNQKRKTRKRRTRAKIFGASAKPRLSVFRSNRFIYVQLIDDEKGHTLVSASSKELNEKDRKKKGIEQALLVGELAARKALQAGIKKALFDRGAYQYHGRIKAVAEGARRAGLSI